jgi:fumarylpyruvate hydrolase
LSLLFELPPAPTLAILGEDKRYPVRRIFCVGRNYAAHAKELGNEVDRDAPIWFTKSPAAFCASGAAVPYALGTEDLHYEMELVAAIGAAAFRVPEDRAMETVMGYACGLDMTRRDLQNALRAKSLPWDPAKDFENSAVLSSITRAGAFGKPGDQRIALSVNGKPRQDARISEMVWSLAELIADLSQRYHLAPGDLIFTGTPAGVGPVKPGDVLEGTVDGLSPVRLTIEEPEL